MPHQRPGTAVPWGDKPAKSPQLAGMASSLTACPLHSCPRGIILWLYSQRVPAVPPNIPNLSKFL